MLFVVERIGRNGRLRERRIGIVALRFHRAAELARVQCRIVSGGRLITLEARGHGAVAR